MKPYRDLFGNPLSKRDVEAATRLIITRSSASAVLIHGKFNWGYGKILRILGLLCDAKVVGPGTGRPRIIILTNEEAAVNAALRQLKKGKK